jgi:hypothetical protein
MVAIVTRSAKGVALTHAEADSNFTNLNTGKLESLDTAAAASALITTNNYQVNSLGVGVVASGTIGEIRATNNVIGYYSSDIKFKENVVPIKDAVKIVCGIGGNLFDWTDDYITSRGGEDSYFIRKQDFGVIAQKVEQYFPRAVHHRVDGSLAVDYEKLVAVAFAAIQEQEARLQKLENLITRMPNGIPVVDNKNNDN